MILKHFSTTFSVFILLLSSSQYVASGKQEEPLKIFSQNQIKALNQGSINNLSATMIKQIFPKLTINQKLLLKDQQLKELSSKQKDEVRILKKPASNTNILIKAETNNTKLKKIIDLINKPNQSAKQSKDIEQALKQYNELKNLIEKNQVNNNLEMKSRGIEMLQNKLMSQFKITDSMLNSVQSAAPASTSSKVATPVPVTSSTTAMQPPTTITAPTVIATLLNPSTPNSTSTSVARVIVPEFSADSTIVSNIKDSTSFDVEFKKVFDDLANEDNTASIYSKMLDGKTDLFILDDSSQLNSFKQTLQTLLALQSKIELSSSQRKFSKLTKPDKYTLDDSNGTETGFAESIIFKPSTIKAFQTESMIWLWYIIMMFVQNAIDWTDDYSKKTSISNAEKIIRSAITGENY